MADYDVITVGGGLGGAALAKALAQQGARVLVVERQHAFKDRIRGEWVSPWGGVEIRLVRIRNHILIFCGYREEIFSLRLPTKFQRSLSSIRQCRKWYWRAQRMRARKSGVELKIRAIKAGQPPRAAVQADGVMRELTARLVVCADGSSSAGRTWLGFKCRRGKQRLFGAGVMFDKMRAAGDTSVFALDSPNGRLSALFPQGRGSVRAYLVWPKDQIPRLQGDRDFGRFIARRYPPGCRWNISREPRLTVHWPASI